MLEFLTIVALAISFLSFYFKLPHFFSVMSVIFSAFLILGVLSTVGAKRR